MNYANFDVVIVGAGIAGSLLARILAENNISVLLLEKDAYSGKTNACGGLLDKLHFDKCSLSEKLIEQKIKKNIFVLPWGEVCFDANQVTVKRRIFDRVLAEHAQTKGAKLRNNSKVLDYEVIENGRVRISVRNLLTNEAYRVEAKIIAFTDGPFSLARKNSRFQSEQNKPFWAYAYAYEVAGVPFEADHIKIYFDEKLFPWGYGWIFPNKNVSNVGVGTLLKFSKKKAYLKQKQFYFLNNYKKTSALLASSEIKDKKGGYIPMKLIRFFVDDSQVVLGDAAGMVSPLFGAGIDYAIDAAVMCAPVLIKSLQQKKYDRKTLSHFEKKLTPLLKELKKQAIITNILIYSQYISRNWPVKILAVIAFGSKYSRWNKLKILFYPLMGKPISNSSGDLGISHK